MSFLSISLADILSLIPKPKYVLGTTYSLSLGFFESSVFHHIGKEKLHACMLITDSLGYRAALEEGSALLGAGTSYVVARAPDTRTFHPKVWLMVGEGEAVLLVGSGNLTQVGFMRNAECFDALHFHAKNKPSERLKGQVNAFIDGLRQLICPENDNPLWLGTLDGIRAAFNLVPVEDQTRDGEPQFLHTFRGDLISQLPTASDSEAYLHVASPYFALSTAGLETLMDRYPRARLQLYPAIHPDDCLDIDPKAVIGKYPEAQIHSLSVPDKDAAFAHLKLYGLESQGGEGWLFTTSANCTRAAWNGSNVEAGILRRVPNGVFKSYFAASNKPLPSKLCEAVRWEPADKSSLSCFALTHGTHGFEIHLAQTAKAPLRDVIIKLRSGSAQFSRHLAQAFDNGVTYTSWQEFALPSGAPIGTVVCEIRGRNKMGEFLTGSCLIENPIRAHCNPAQSRAHQCVQLLLSSESTDLLRLQDLQELLKLSDPLLHHKSASQPTGNTSATSPQKEVRLLEPTWPPQPYHGASYHHGRSMQDVYWFQSVMAKLMDWTRSCESSGTQQLSKSKAPTPEDEEDPESDVDVEVPARARLNFDDQKAWKLTKGKFAELIRWLEGIQSKGMNSIQDLNQTHVWPHSLNLLLIVLLILSRLRELHPERYNEAIQAEICQQFLRPLFYNTKPVARQLYDAGILPSRDHACIMLALIICKTAWTQGTTSYQPWMRKRMQLLFGDATLTDEDLKTIRGFWRKHFEPSPDLEEMLKVFLEWQHEASSPALAMASPRL